MDADLDGTIDTLDIVYINAVLAKKFRFLSNETSNVISISQQGCSLSLNATLFMDTGEAVSDPTTTSVLFVLGDVTESHIASVSVGEYVTESDDGVVLVATLVEKGVFQNAFSFEPGQGPAQLGIVVVITTYVHLFTPNGCGCGMSSPCFALYRHGIVLLFNM